MQSRQTDARNSNHGTLENHQCYLVIGQATVESTLELGHSEGRTDQNSQDSNCQA